MVEKEIRKIENQISNISDRKIEGYAIVFNSLSENLGGFREIIDPSAIEGVLEKSDIYCLLNHSKDKFLARSKNMTGSLKLEVDGHGLKYSFDSPRTWIGDEALELIKRGDITTSSFAFTVADGGDEWVKNTDGVFTRKITKFENLYDCSPVFLAAYSETSVECKRFLEIQETDKNLLKEIEEKEDRELKELMDKEEEKRKEELKTYYENLRNSIPKKIIKS